MSKIKEKLDNYINYCEINDELNPLSFKERELFIYDMDNIDTYSSIIQTRIFDLCFSLKEESKENMENKIIDFIKFSNDDKYEMFSSSDELEVSGFKFFYTNSTINFEDEPRIYSTDIITKIEISEDFLTSFDKTMRPKIIDNPKNVGLKSIYEYNPQRNPKATGLVVENFKEKQNRNVNVSDDLFSKNHTILNKLFSDIFGIPLMDFERMYQDYYEGRVREKEAEEEKKRKAEEKEEEKKKAANNERNRSHKEEVELAKAASSSVDIRVDDHSRTDTKIGVAGVNSLPMQLRAAPVKSSLTPAAELLALTAPANPSALDAGKQLALTGGPTIEEVDGGGKTSSATFLKGGTEAVIEEEEDEDEEKHEDKVSIKYKSRGGRLMFKGSFPKHIKFTFRTYKECKETLRVNSDQKKKSIIYPYTYDYLDKLFSFFYEKHTKLVGRQPIDSIKLNSNKVNKLFETTPMTFLDIQRINYNVNNLDRIKFGGKDGKLLFTETKNISQFKDEEIFLDLINDPLYIKNNLGSSIREEHRLLDKALTSIFSNINDQSVDNYIKFKKVNKHYIVFKTLFEQLKDKLEDLIKSYIIKAQILHKKYGEEKDEKKQKEIAIKIIELVQYPELNKSDIGNLQKIIEKIIKDNHDTSFYKTPPITELTSKDKVNIEEEFKLGESKFTNGVILSLKEDILKKCKELNNNFNDSNNTNQKRIIRNKLIAIKHFIDLITGMNIQNIRMMLEENISQLEQFELFKDVSGILTAERAEYKEKTSKMNEEMVQYKTKREEELKKNLDNLQTNNQQISEEITSLKNLIKDGYYKEHRRVRHWYGKKDKSKTAYREKKIQSEKQIFEEMSKFLTSENLQSILVTDKTSLWYDNIRAEIKALEADRVITF